MHVGVAGVLLVLLTVSACGGSEAGPRVLPSVTSSPSVTASATAAPTGINAPTPAGATEFARFAYGEIRRAFDERDATLISAIAEPDCAACNNFASSVKELAAQNGRLEGFVITVRDAVAPAAAGDRTRVDVIRDSTASTFYDSGGRVIGREPGLRGVEEQMNLVRRGDQWKIAQILRIRVRG